MQDALVGAAVQIGGVLVLCVFFWLIFGRKVSGFFRYLGLTPPPALAMGIAFVVGLGFAAATVAAYYFSPLKELAAGPSTVAASIRSMGLSPETALVIAILAFLKTALAEEILFRGLIAKRLIRLAGFWAGNALQAAAFAAMHLIVFATPDAPAFSLTLAGPMMAIIFASSLTMVWLNERLAKGSIGPSWLMHGLANAVAYPVFAFA